MCCFWKLNENTCFGRFAYWLSLNFNRCLPLLRLGRDVSLPRLSERRRRLKFRSPLLGKVKSQMFIKIVLNSVNSRRFGNNPFISWMFQPLGQNQRWFWPNGWNIRLMKGLFPKHLKLTELSTFYEQFWVYLGVRTCKLFLCFVAIVRVRVYYVDFFVFFVLRHWWVSQVLTPRQSHIFYIQG